MSHFVWNYFFYPYFKSNSFLLSLLILFTIIFIFFSFVLFHPPSPSLPLFFFSQIDSSNLLSLKILLLAKSLFYRWWVMVLVAVLHSGVFTNNWLTLLNDGPNGANPHLKPTSSLTSNKCSKTHVISILFRSALDECGWERENSLPWFFFSHHGYVTKGVVFGFLPLCVSPEREDLEKGRTRNRG